MLSLLSASEKTDVPGRGQGVGGRSLVDSGAAGVVGSAGVAMFTGVVEAAGEAGVVGRDDRRLVSVSSVSFCSDCKSKA